MTQQSVSERRSCELIGIWRSSYRYQPVARDDGELAAELHEIAAAEATAGYRTAWAYLRQDGLVVNHKRVQRVWKEEGLTQPVRKGRKRATGGSVPLQATHVNESSEKRGPTETVSWLLRLGLVRRFGSPSVSAGASARLRLCSSSRTGGSPKSILSGTQELDHPLRVDDEEGHEHLNRHPPAPAVPRPAQLVMPLRLAELPFLHRLSQGLGR